MEISPSLGVPWGKAGEQIRGRSAASCSCDRTGTSSCNAGAVGVGLWGEGKRRYPCAPRRRGARPRRRELTGETRTLRGSKHDGLGETKAVGKKQRGLQVRGFIGRRERHAYETGSSLSTFVSCFLSPPSLPLSLENLVPGTGKAARLVALSQADPQLPMAGLVSPFS